MDMPVPDAAPDLLKEADLCVQCGLCLPHCPTFRVTRDENESPRGRIQLMRALARGQLPLTSKLTSHLDRCLVCRTCEAVCPAGVPYGSLMDRTRAHIRRSRPAGGRQRLLEKLAARPERLHALVRWARIGQRTGLRFLARHTGLLRSLDLAPLDAALPDLPPARPWEEHYPAPGRARGKVSLFLGCIARVLDAETIAAAIFVLNRLGYDVHVPPGQVCCGALHGHAGNAEAARELAQANLRAFGSGSEVILYLASGCGAQLIAYPEPLRSRWRDFCELIAALPDLPALRSGREAVVAVHEPCTQRNVLCTVAPVYNLLRRLENLRVVPLEDNGVCCGGAGSYFLDQPELADRLRTDKLAAVERAGVRTVVTGNIGCALHLNGGLRARGLDVELIHPAVLLRRIIESAGA
jgi:glycolate oxidase iron-sulfur subunit